MSDGETTNPGHPELTDRDRSLAKAIAEATHANGGPWWKRYGPALAFIISLGTIAGGLIWFGDSRYQTDQEATDAAVVVETADKEAHEKIREDFNARTKALLEGLTEEVRVRSMLGKDVEAEQKDINRLERRVGRLEDRR